MRPDDRIGRFEVRPFPLSRTPIVDTGELGKARHHIPVLFEVDVTRAREALRLRKDAAGGQVSFTGWVVKCLAQAASENKRAHAMRWGRRQLVLFDDVDVGLVVQREMTGGGGESLPLPYLIRKANAKSLDEIRAEIRGAQSARLKPGEQVLGEKEKRRPVMRPNRLFFRLPFFLRKLLAWNRLKKSVLRQEDDGDGRRLLHQRICGCRLRVGVRDHDFDRAPGSLRRPNRPQARSRRGRRRAPRVRRPDDPLRPRRDRRSSYGRLPRPAAGVDGGSGVSLSPAGLRRKRESAIMEGRKSRRRT